MNIIKEFREKFVTEFQHPDRLWKKNHITKEMEQFILSKLKEKDDIIEFIMESQNAEIEQAKKEVAEGCIQEKKQPNQSLAALFGDDLTDGYNRHRQEGIDYCNKIGINIK